MSFKGYSRCKTITSQNVSSETQLKISTKSVTSWWVLIHETVCLFEYIFWTTTHEVTKLGQVIDISKANNFQEFFKHLRGLGLSSRSCSIYLPTCCNYSTANYVKISVFHFFEEVNNWTFTNGKCEL